MTGIRPKTSLMLVLLMAWVSVWCCCQSMAAPAAAEMPTPVATCCAAETGADRSTSLTDCALPADDPSSDCPFLEARVTTWLRADLLPDLRPDFVAAVDVLDPVLLSPIDAGPRFLRAAPAHGPPRTPLAMAVCLLC